MKNRVVGKRRMSRENREVSIVRVLASDGRLGYNSSLSSIARSLGITPSTYLLNILKEMSIKGSITVRSVFISELRSRHLWSAVYRDEVDCDAPWKCGDDGCIDKSKHICRGDST